MTAPPSAPDLVARLRDFDLGDDHLELREEAAAEIERLTLARQQVGDMLVKQAETIERLRETIDVNRESWTAMGTENRRLTRELDEARSDWRAANDEVVRLRADAELAAKQFHSLEDETNGLRGQLDSGLIPEYQTDLNELSQRHSKVCHDFLDQQKEIERLRALLQKYKYESRLQSFEDRERFRQEADEALRGAGEKT